MTPLSVYVLTFNSERHLTRVLEAVARIADDLLVVDSGSTDATYEIAYKYGARVVHRSFDNFRSQRLFAHSLCLHETIMFFDSDEIASESLIDEVMSLKKSGFTYDAYVVRRDWIVMGKVVHALFPVGCPDWPVRIIHRDRVDFTVHSVHESLIGYKSIGRIESSLVHHTFETKTELMRKLDLYTDLAAEDLKNTGRRKRALKIRQYISPIGAFVKWYFRSGNWLDGRVGWILAIYAMKYTHHKYRKLLLLIQRLDPE